MLEPTYGWWEVQTFFNSYFEMLQYNSNSKDKRQILTTLWQYIVVSGNVNL